MLRLSDALENRQGGGAGTRMNVSWSAIEQITSGKLGRTMAVCPLCSANRRTPQKRHSKVLAINLLESEFAVYYCNHCGTQGYAYPESRSRNLDLAEQQRRRDEANRHAEKEKQARTQQALKLWEEAKPCRGSPIEDYLYTLVESATGS